MDVNWKLVAVGIALLVVAGVGVVLESPDERTASRDGTAGTASTPPRSDGDGSAGTPTDVPPFDVDVEAIEACGRTCRDVTATIVNDQDRRATGVTVSTRIYAGDDTGGDPLWEETRDVGTLDPGESATATSRIELGFFDAAAIEANGGRITIELVVDTDRQTVRFVEHRHVT